VYPEEVLRKHVEERREAKTELADVQKGIKEAERLDPDFKMRLNDKKYGDAYVALKHCATWLTSGAPYLRSSPI
jgi:hypothetical protein